ncbi:MAG: adenylosuccinate lyase [Pseudomonadota bacterium]
MSQFDPLTAIGAADGRYRSKSAGLPEVVSEYGLMKYRVQVECEWFVFLSELAGVTEFPTLSDTDQQHVRSIVNDFSTSDAEHIKRLESTTNHDVKAVEYFVKEKLRAHATLEPLTEWVHFSCTSEDINNTAYALMVKTARDSVLMPQMRELITAIDSLALQHADLGMLSRTHGQTASPTTLGKELKNVAARLQRQMQLLERVDVLGKFNGAVGNFNAHLSAYPQIDWITASDAFIQQLGLVNNPWTTQIEPHDYLAELFHCLVRFNQILLDFDRDIWMYIAIEYFKQKKVEGETGSSTMPHKVNPIDFENSEGNLGIANALLVHMAEKLPVSRWQRDLSDSTVLRNIGTAFAHCAIAYQATLKGMSRLEVNSNAIKADLDNSWEVLAEPVQTVMRKYGLPEPYEQLKAATRGEVISAARFDQILAELNLPEAALAELADLTPQRYTGAAADLARRSLD